MKHQDVRVMAEILRAKFQAEHNAFGKLLAQEQSIRRSLEELDEHSRRSETSTGSHMRVVGADVIWKAWVGRTKTRLNLELSQILAMKEVHKKKVAKAFGKVSVAENLDQEICRTRQSEIEESSLEKAIEMHNLQYLKRR